MDKATQTMIDNLYKKTGKTLTEWIAIVNKEKQDKHGTIVAMLKEQYGFTHGFANLVAHAVKANPGASSDDLIQAQYTGKEHFKQLYDTLISTISAFGNDVEISPKKTYVSLRRKKQFAILQPATKTRFEIGLNLKSVDSSGKLTPINSANAMCTHKIILNPGESPDDEIIGWIRHAYEKAF